MNKYIVVSLLVGILIGSGVGYVCFWWINLRKQSKPLYDVKVGIFYYVWYDPNLLVSWEYPKICDKPLIGYYNSCDPEIIATHFKWISELGINFIILSYWGQYFQWSEYTFRLNTIHQIFKMARENITNVKLCLMIEPFDRRDQPSYNYTEIYNYVYTNFVEPYPTVYFKYQGKPLLTLFNDPNLTPQGIYLKDNRFSMFIIGGDYYADWIYTDLVPVSGSVPRNRQISVTPRFDDSRFRVHNYTIDIDLSEGVYDKQWKRAIDLAKQNAIDVITICSWNEFPERTAIEPHWDADAYDHNPYFLYNKTKKSIETLRGEPVDCELDKVIRP